MRKTKKLILLSVMAVMTLGFFVYQKVNAANAPALKEGTYLTGQTLSIWPSWSVLGNTLGVNLPSDPINQLATAGTCVTSTNRFCINDSQCPAGESCVLHDPETGWSVANRRFTFACSRDSYAYRYIASTTPGFYTVRAHFEDSGISPANYNSFVASFVSTSIFKINDSSGVCNFDQEISSMQSGACGDGKLNTNKGEQCDPPGRIEYAAGCVGSIRNLTVCNKNCQWTASTTPCSSLSKCGNGSREFGETCDDGNLNGKYNHCNITCNGVSALGKCGDSVLQSAYEICDPGAGGVEKYNLNKNLSCAWDCQNFGPYCGDSITQTKFGEECDGSQTCSADGNPGARVCESNCRKKDADAAAWWRLDALVGSQTVDASVNANNATCTSPNCPVVGMGKYGQGFTFTQNSNAPRFLTVASSASLTPTTSFTVEAWIYPINTTTRYQRIVERGGPSVGRGYDLEFNTSATTSAVRFNLWNGPQQTAVDSRAIATLVWTHVVGTYEKSGTGSIAKIYINGVLENTNVSSAAGGAMGALVKTSGNLSIGKSTTISSTGSTNTNFFFGSMDEIKIYNRALSASEIQNNYESGWYCATTSTPVVSATSGCGDNVVDANEACDRGTANNGRACSPTYGQTCSYCSADCQNTIDVQPAQYCGNGVIESSEKCEVAGGNIFSSVTTTGRTTSIKNLSYNGYQELACANETTPPHTIRKGSKSCADCALGTVRTCVQCGADVTGVSVDGNLINVLENPITSSPLDPLFVKKITYGALSLSVSLCKSSTGVELCPPWLPPVSPLVARALKNINSDLVSYSLHNPHISGYPPALINSDPICSAGDSFNDKYQMYVNYDWSRPLNFPVVADPQSWQYDLVLSPVVSSTKRAKDLRVVVSWVGSGDFYSGVFNPFASTTLNQNPQIEGAAYVVPGPSYKYANGINYYNAPADFKKFGVWYHGFNTTLGQTSAEAFTIDTAFMNGNTYSFYVRAPSYPIRTFKNTAKLKVDVFLPEQDSNQYHYGTPARTYYFIAASPSDNPNARYWQVFNINAPRVGLSVADITDINAIVTGPAYFKYTNPLVANSTCTAADWQSSYSPSVCPLSQTQTRTWTKTTNCINGVQHPPTETVSCQLPVLQPTTQPTTQPTSKFLPLQPITQPSTLQQ